LRDSLHVNVLLAAMAVELKPLRAVTWQAIEVLSRELGIADTMRFLNQFTSGYGNYTEERSDLFADMSLDDLVKGIREQRSH
jgi:hypothetical protein